MQLTKNNNGTTKYLSIFSTHEIKYGAEITLYLDSFHAVGIYRGRASYQKN